MRETDRVILIKNAVETLGYFSEQIALEMERCGIHTYFVDYDHLGESLAQLPWFAVWKKTALVTFNFIGFSGEDFFLDEVGHSIWDGFAAQYINILVDHPLYYHKRLMALPEQIRERMTLFCVDREHVAYVKRFYPGMKVYFLPLAGNVCVDGGKICRNAVPDQRNEVSIQKDELTDQQDETTIRREEVPYRNRNYDLVFTANYVSFDRFYEKIRHFEPEYRSFYQEILEDLIFEPAQSIDRVMERHLRQKFCGASDGELASAMSDMVLVDLCIRAYFREKVIAELANHDVTIHLFGADWKLLARNKGLIKKPQNLICNSRQITSPECAKTIADARISLNVMPWFKDGAHDRIFTSMLQKTVALTDDSRYLREAFSGGEDILFFSLKKLEALPQIVMELLNQPQKAEKIAKKGYCQAKEGHTWQERTQELMRRFEE